MSSRFARVLAWVRRIYPGLTTTLAFIVAGILTIIASRLDLAEILNGFPS